MRRVTRWVPERWRLKPDTLVKPDAGLASEVGFSQQAAEFLAGRRVPFAEQPETASQAAVRLSGAAVRAARQAAEMAPLGLVGRGALRTIGTVDFVRQYGLHGLAGFYFRQEVMQAAQLLHRAAGRIGPERPGMAQLLPALYYRAAENAGARGRDPTEPERRLAGGRLTREELATLRPYAAMALFIAYEEPVAAQRGLKHHGYQLVLAQTAPGRSDQPGFLLAADPKTKQAALIVRGTRSAVDWLANAEFSTVRLGPGEAHSGMLRRAHWLDAHVGPALDAFEADGYTLTFTGHSQGAGVAALLAMQRSMSSGREPARCYGFGIPPVVDAELCDRPEAKSVLSVVLQDDLVPRASLQNTTVLLGRLAEFDWSQHAAADWDSIYGAPPGLIMV